MKFSKSRRIKDRIGVNFVNILLTAAVALATLLVIYFLLLAAPPAQADDKHPLIGKEMPDFELFDYARKAHKLSDFRGKAVLIVFWWPADANCEAALKAVHIFHDKYTKDNLSVIAIDLKAQTSKALMQLMKMEIDYLCLEGIYKDHISDYQLRGVPSIFLVDKKGIVKAFYAGVEEIRQIEVALDLAVKEN
jgi:thiol-disulfide isomerase/thioredoxin